MENRQLENRQLENRQLENRQFGSQAAQALAPVRNVWQLAGSIVAIVGASLLGSGAFVFILSFFFSSRAATLSLLITGGSLAFVGAILFAVASSFRGLARREQDNLHRLKTEGHSFPAEITNIVRQPHIHVGRSTSAYAECTYQNRDGKTCLVRSRSFMYNGENYTAWVYVNPFDPMDYAVEIFVQSPRADFDYR